MSNLTIGKLAKKSNVNIATIRYYEKRGLIETPSRTESGYRIFSPGTITDIKMIKRAQNLGFTLKEIKKIISIYKGDDYFPTKEMYELSKMRILKINEEIEQLNNLKNLLESAMNCKVEEPSRSQELCPLLNTLTKRRE